MLSVKRQALAIFALAAPRMTRRKLREIYRKDFLSFRKQLTSMDNEFRIIIESLLQKFHDTPPRQEAQVYVICMPRFMILRDYLQLVVHEAQLEIQIDLVCVVVIALMSLLVTAVSVVRAVMLDVSNMSRQSFPTSGEGEEACRDAEAFRRAKSWRGRENEAPREGAAPDEPQRGPVAFRRRDALCQVG